MIFDIIILIFNIFYRLVATLFTTHSASLDLKPYGKLIINNNSKFREICAIEIFMVTCNMKKMTYCISNNKAFKIIL